MLMRTSGRYIMGSTNTKEQLELKALQFFANNDFDRSNLNDIARALNVTKGAIYHYFSGKDDLFKAAVNRLLDELMSLFRGSLPREIPVKTVLDNLFEMSLALKDLSNSLGLGNALGEYKNILYFFIVATKKFPETQGRLDLLYKDFQHNLEDLLNAGIVRGEIRRDVDSKALAFEITAFYEGALLLGAFSDNKDFEVLGPRVCDSIWKRIALIP